MMMLGGLAIIGIIGYLVWDRAQREREAAGEPKDRSLDLLRERYARGEISKEEFDERRKTLEAL
ncbi:MAG: SHOCT domain-containing protein [Actinobacteria bacterium]|nr:SHOCT domain-containing protein [Actinomycetota bacterium]